MSHYTNTRASKVSVAKHDLIPGETKDLGEDAAKILEQKDAKGNLTHPLRKGANPILQPGKVEMPPVAESPKVPSLRDLDIPRALAQVKLCSDLNTLATWAATEERSDIKSALESRGRELAGKG